MLHSLPMRHFALCAALAACQAGASDMRDLTNTNPGTGGGGAAAECTRDADCALAADKCCDCPTFAVSISDPAHTACESIACPMSSCPQNARAACEDGACVLACAPLACATSCPQGYAIDPTGCLECACAAIAAPACAADSDCVQTRADCCGCTRGGADTAVPSSQQAAFDASLGCPNDPQCPGTDTCTPGVGPRCIEGACALAPPTPAGACTGTCPAGQQCVINSDATASAQGVGVCM